MVWKVVNISDSGTSSKHGADDLDKVAKLFNGVDVDDVDINADFKFRSGKLQIANPANTFKYNILGSALTTVNKDLTLPLLTGDDTFTVNSLAQTLSNKTLDSSCVLPSTVVRTNATNAMGDFDTSFKDNRIRIWNPADTFRYTLVGGAITLDANLNLPVLTDNDTITVNQLAQTLTNKTVDNKSNKLGLRLYTSIVFKDGSDYYARKYDGTLISQDSVFETVMQAAINAEGIVYLSSSSPNASGDTLYDCSGSFTGFTITNQTVIIGSNLDKTWIGVPNGFTGTVFNSKTKELSGFSIYEQGSPARDWTGIKMTCGSGENIAFGKFHDLQIYDSNIGIELETTHSTAYINDNDFTRITIWSPDTAGILFDQQSGDMDQNTFNGVDIQCRAGSTGQGFKDISGTNNQFISCVVWDPDDAVIETNIKSTGNGTMIIGGRMMGGKGHYINQGNRTLEFDTGKLSTINVHCMPSLVKTGAWYGSIANFGDGILAGRIVSSNVGTGSNSGTLDSTGQYRTFSTGATTNSLASIRSDTLVTNRIQNGYFKAKITTGSNIANTRIFCGLINSGAAPASSADPLNALEGIMLWYDSAVNANWRRLHNDSSGAGTSDDTSVAVATSTDYIVEIYALADTKFRFVFNGVSTDISSNIPASATGLSFRIGIENTTGSDRTLKAHYAEVKCDR